MTKEEEKNLQKLETRVRQFILTYKTLEASQLKLQAALRQKEEQIAQLEEQNKQLQMQYQNLKLAKIMTLDSGDTVAARQRLTRLIKEVDKCIALLNV